MAGRFITFEGGDGAGKTTQIRRLADRLAAHGERVTITREPGGTPAAEAIRAAVLSGRAKPLGAEAEAMLFAAARADHVDRLIRPKLAAGDWVLSDRFADSTHVYQGEIGGVDRAFLDALDQAAIGATRPDLTIVIDVPTEVGLARLARRLNGGGVPDRFESDAEALHARRRQAFLDLAAGDPGRCIVVDGSVSEEAVAATVWRAVEARLLSRAA